MTDDTIKPVDKRTNSSRGGKSGGTGRPSSAASNSTVGGKNNNPDSASEHKKGDSVSRQGSHRGRGHGGGRGGHRKISSTSQNGSRSGGGNTAPKASQPASVPVPSQTEGSDALQSLQRVITDLKSISPPTNVAPLSGNVPLGSSLSNSNLPANAPVFQPGATAFPVGGDRTSPKHRKAASMGSSPAPLPVNYTSPLQHFQSNLGAMAEDSEQSGPYEEGEIPEPMSWQQQQDFPGAIQRASSGGFVAPRFAAMAQQQQQAAREVLGPSGRPQLAPGFTFGARRKPSSNAMPMGPPIDEEEDANFQFPQAMAGYKQDPSPASTGSRRPETTDIGGIMAEQIAIQAQIESLQQQQQQLYQQQLASSQVMASLTSSNLQSNRLSAHRRTQTATGPMFMGQGNLGLGVNSISPLGAYGGSLGVAPQGEDIRGHGRRHSVNVINKQSMGSFGQNTQDGFDDGFNPPAVLGGHSRNPSRVDPAWNVSAGNFGLQDNLDQAQQQLRSLQQFRAAAGGHHQKMASFSFPNMLPNMLAANMVGLNAMNVNMLQQQQQQFQMQLQQQSNQPQRKSLFAPYLPQASLPPLLAAGKLVVGILRVNKRNRSDAYVATEVLEADIYICGSKDRNRALEGDIVAVELLDVDEVWGTKKEKEEKKRKKEENAAYDTKVTGNRKNEKKKDDVEVEGQGLMLFEDEEVTDDTKPQYAGHVVAVVERMPGQLFSGTLGLLRPSSAATKEKQEAERREREGDRAVEQRKGQVERPKIVWFRPTDKRVPLIAIPTEQAPPDFVQNSESYTDRLFVACIKRHPISSLHPFGTLVEELGPIGDIEVETSALLKDCNFPSEEFSDNVLKCVPPTPWTIPEHEFEVRRDLRANRIFTIDPPDAKDLDDALSIQCNEDGTYDVGVHIADVSYFVRPNTALDRDARKRGTSVYLVQRAVPMLPPILSEQLCSLIPGQERLAFSVIFTMDADGRVTNKWFGKTIIKSTAKLSYGDAQSLLNGNGISATVIDPNVDGNGIKEDIAVLCELAKHLRDRRSANGILSISSERLNLDLDATGRPVDCGFRQPEESSRLVEEFMLLTNETIAQQIAFSLPDQAFLRRHENAIDRRLVNLAEKAERMGFKLDTSSAGSITLSLEAVDNTEARKVLELASHKAIHQAKYFCAGMLDIAKYHHFALNTPLYTHFTSPIRRYADIIVHRQLDSVLPSSNSDSKVTMDRDSVAKVAQHCNLKRDSAKLAEEQSTHLYLCHLIADLTARYGPVVRQAVVVNVLDAAFDVLLPEFGIEKRVHIDQMPIENNVYDEHNHTLSIYWSTRDVIAWLAENNDDEHLQKVKKNAEQHAVNMEVASRSVLDENALFEEDDDEIIISKEPEKETSKQRLLSKSRTKPMFQGLRQVEGHRIQDIKELMTVPVIVTADLTKSPAVIKVYSVNPYAAA